MVALLKFRNATPRQMANVAEVRGKPRGSVTGSHLDDLAACGKAILLTDDEARRFNAKAYGYASNPRMPRARGFSDASGIFCEGVLFLKKD